MGSSIPLLALEESQNQIITCETNDLTIYTGILIKTSRNLDCTLGETEIKYKNNVTAIRSGVYIPGTQINYIVLPPASVRAVICKKLEEAKTQKNKNKINSPTKNQGGKSYDGSKNNFQKFPSKVYGTPSKNQRAQYSPRGQGYQQTTYFSRTPDRGGRGMASPSRGGASPFMPQGQGYAGRGTWHSPRGGRYGSPATPSKAQKSLVFQQDAGTRDSRYLQSPGQKRRQSGEAPEREPSTHQRPRHQNNRQDPEGGSAIPHQELQYPQPPQESQAMEYSTEAGQERPAYEGYPEGVQIMHPGTYDSTYTAQVQLPQPQPVTYFSVPPWQPQPTYGSPPVVYPPPQSQWMSPPMAFPPVPTVQPHTPQYVIAIQQPQFTNQQSPFIHQNPNVIPFVPIMQSPPGQIHYHLGQPHIQGQPPQEYYQMAEQQYYQHPSHLPEQFYQAHPPPHAQAYQQPVQVMPPNQVYQQQPIQHKPGQSYPNQPPHPSPGQSHQNQ